MAPLGFYQVGSRDSPLEYCEEQQIEEYQSQAFQDADKSYVLAAMENDPQLVKKLADGIRHALQVKAEQAGLTLIHQNVRRMNQLNQEQMHLIFTSWHGEKWANSITRVYNANQQRNVILLGTGANEKTKIPVDHGLKNVALVSPCLLAYHAILV